MKAVTRDPVKRREYNKTYYARNKARFDAQNKVYRESHRAEALAHLAEWREAHPDYMKNYRKEHPEIIRAQQERYLAKHRSELNLRRKETAEKLRVEFLIAYGEPKSGHICGVCPCCGEDLLRFGTLHHINGDGREHRKEKCHHAMLREAIEHPDKSRFAALCFNCNLAAERNGGQCPGHGLSGR